MGTLAAPWMSAQLLEGMVALLAGSPQTESEKHPKFIKTITGLLKMGDSQPSLSQLEVLASDFPWIDVISSEHTNLPPKKPLPTHREWDCSSQSPLEMGRAQHHPEGDGHETSYPQKIKVFTSPDLVHGEMLRIFSTEM